MATDTLSLAVDALEARQATRLLQSIVVPRPIGWVSTLSAAGQPNLAPFSYFNGVSSSPPVVMFAVSQRSARFGGGVKDTLRNVQEIGEFVVNFVDETLVEAMNQTAGEWDPTVNEFELAGLTTAPSVDVRPPRVAEAPVAMEARVLQIIPVAETSSTMVLGRIVRFHIQPTLMLENGQVDTAALQPVARLGGSNYAKLGEIFSLERPKIAPKSS